MDVKSQLLAVTILIAILLVLPCKTQVPYIQGSWIVTYKGPPRECGTKRKSGNESFDRVSCSRTQSATVQGYRHSTGMHGDMRMIRGFSFKMHATARAVMQELCKEYVPQRVKAVATNRWCFQVAESIHNGEGRHYQNAGVSGGPVIYPTSVTGLPEINGNPAAMFLCSLKVHFAPKSH
eukprot:762708-Hanusia_phi.AAC.2